jgi:hypothetical protein
MYTLVLYMDPYYQSRHARQSVGLEGPDLAGQRHREIMAAARHISEDSILQFDMTQFHVASESNPGTYYAIDLHRETCDCTDFPRAHFCKHIAAIHVHFPHLVASKPCSIVPPNATQVPDKPQCASTSLLEESLQSLTQEIVRVSQSLTSGSITQSTPAPAVMEAVRSAKYSLSALSAAIASTEEVSALPERDRIAPNQKSWPETAKRMGVKRAPKRKRLPEERGITEQSIGVAKGKKRRLHQDPYAGGERSGKRAKPDALSAAATTQARACMAPSGPSPLMPTSQAPPSAATSSLAPAPCSQRSQEPHFSCWQGTT